MKAITGLGIRYRTRVSGDRQFALFQKACRKSAWTDKTCKPDGRITKLVSIISTLVKLQLPDSFYALCSLCHFQMLKRHFQGNELLTVCMRSARSTWPTDAATGERADDCKRVEIAGLTESSSTLSVNHLTPAYLPQDNPRESSPLLSQVMTPSFPLPARFFNLGVITNIYRFKTA